MQSSAPGKLSLIFSSFQFLFTRIHHAWYTATQLYTNSLQFRGFSPMVDATSLLMFLLNSSSSPSFPTPSFISPLLPSFRLRKIWHDISQMFSEFINSFTLGKQHKAIRQAQIFFIAHMNDIATILQARQMKLA